LASADNDEPAFGRDAFRRGRSGRSISKPTIQEDGRRLARCVGAGCQPAASQKECHRNPALFYETDDALTVVMEIPGVQKKHMDIHIENDVLRVEGRVDFGNYEGMEPLYTEYNVGHFARAFTLSSKIDQQQISARVEDGVLTLTLKKARDATPRRISVS